MIRSDSEYEHAVKRLAAAKERLAVHQWHLEQQLGLPPAEVKRALDPLRSFQAQLEEEISLYTRMR